MNKEIETIFQNEDGVRIAVDEWSDGVWLSFQARHASMHTTFTRDEAELLLVALQKVLAKEVTA
jgi:hypothetical protein